MSRKENQKFWRKTVKGKAAQLRHRGSISDIQSRIRYEEKRLAKATIIKALKSGNYNVQDMYEAIRESFPDHTEKMILDVMRVYPTKRQGEISVQEYESNRGVVIPVTGSFPEYYEEDYES